MAAKVPLQERISRMRDDASLSYGPSCAWMDRLHSMEPTPWPWMFTGELFGYFRGLAAFQVYQRSDAFWGPPQIDWFVIYLWQTMLVLVAVAVWRLERERETKLIATGERRGAVMDY